MSTVPTPTELGRCTHGGWEPGAGPAVRESSLGSVHCGFELPAASTEAWPEPRMLGTGPQDLCSRHAKGGVQGIWWQTDASSVTEWVTEAESMWSD